jgi:hypothetical protein
MLKNNPRRQLVEQHREVSMGRMRTLTYRPYQASSQYPEGLKDTKHRPPACATRHSGTGQRWHSGKRTAIKPSSRTGDI